MSTPLSIRGTWLGQRKKWLVTVATFAAGIIDLGYVSGDARLWVGVVLLALNSAGVHQATNNPAA